MADINAGLNNLISQYGTDAAKAKNGIDVPVKDQKRNLTDKDVFMTLYIEQLQAQDPTDPQDTNKMVSQMAEMSSLEELTTISSQLDKMTASFTSSQAISASTLVGQKIMTATDKAVLDENGDMPVKVLNPNDYPSATLEVRNTDGELVRKLELEGMGESFKWDGKDDEGNMLAAGEYEFKAAATDKDGNRTKLQIELPAKIEGVTISGKDGTELNVSGVGKISLTDELEIVG
ncbi:flagellar biosynthesis protein FlgD [Marinomonas agarivorans]|nr:flagellar biosynthesis protein FlgD [Marinomonas agarivorans]